MNKLNKILSFALALVTVMALAVGLASCGSKEATYTKSYEVESAEATPEGIFTESGKSAALGYIGSFGNFVDKVTVEGTLEVKGDEYTFTWQVHCGSDASVAGSYDPEFIWTGAVTESTDTSVTIAAPTTAQITINATKQFATNAEQTGYFGVVGYVATHETTDCPYSAVPSGSALLGMIQAGTYSVSGTTLGTFTKA